MPLFVKRHMRAGHSVKAYRRNTTITTRARNLAYALGSITASGRFLSKPQKKAFFKANTIAARRRPRGISKWEDTASLKQFRNNESMKRERY